MEEIFTKDLTLKYLAKVPFYTQQLRLQIRSHTLYQTIYIIILYILYIFIHIIHTDTPEVEVASVSYLHRHEAWMRADGSSTGVDEEGSLYAFGIERIGLSADFGQQHVEIWGFQVTLVLPCSRYVVYIYMVYVVYFSMYLPPIYCNFNGALGQTIGFWPGALRKCTTLL